MKKFFKKNWPILFLFIIVLPITLEILKPGFPITDDGGKMIIRLSAFHETLRAGQFPVRFLDRLNFTYGYPVLNFLYPLPFYAGEAIHLLGFNFIDSIKILFALSFPLGTLFMYLWIRPKMGFGAGIISAVFYSYFPYHLLDVYKRGSLGEVIAFAFIPMVFYFCDKLQQTKKWHYLSFGGVALAALITSHNTLGFLFFPLVVIYSFSGIIYTKEKPAYLLQVVTLLLLGLSMSAFFWIPALHDLQYTRVGQSLVGNYQDYFLNWNNFFPFIGILTLPIIIISLLIFLKKRNTAIIALTLLVLLSIFLSTSLSNFIWEHSFLPRVVQFPWRFISLTTFALSVLLAHIFNKKKSIILILIAIIIIVISGTYNLKVSRTFYPESYYSTDDGSTTVNNEYMPKWVLFYPTFRPPHTLEILSGQGELLSDRQIKAQTDVVLRINKVFFPGLEILVNGKKAPFNYQKNGMPELTLPPGTYEVVSRFVETPTRQLANFISLAGLGIAIILIKRGISP